MSFTHFAATYNCSDSANQAYGTGNYSTCDGATIGAPDTGFAALGNSWAILLPLAAIIILAIISTVLIRYRRAKQKS